MGQYYKPVNLDSLEYVHAHDVKEKVTYADGSSHMMGNGLKLMEHSWMNNGFVGAVEKLLSPGEAWHKCKFTWAGDYGDEIHEVENLNKDEDNPEDTAMVNSYMLASDFGTQVKVRGTSSKRRRYIVNHTTKEFVDKSKVPADNEGWKVHPLPILTANGNGRGGGDLHEERIQGNENLVGAWDGHVISVETNKKALVGYKEVIFDIIEK